MCKIKWYFNGKTDAKVFQLLLFFFCYCYSYLICIKPTFGIFLVFTFFVFCFRAGHKLSARRWNVNETFGADIFAPRRSFLCFGFAIVCTFVCCFFFCCMFAKRMIYVAKAAFGGTKRERERAWTRGERGRERRVCTEVGNKLRQMLIQLRKQVQNATKSVFK